MNTNFNNEFSDPFDLYMEYSNGKIKEATKSYSKIGFAIVLFIVASYAIIFLTDLILILALGEEKMTSLYGNVYFHWIMGVGPIYLIGFPAFLLLTKNMKKQALPKGKISKSDFVKYIFMAEGLMILGNLIGSTINGIISSIIGREISNSVSDLIEITPVWLIILVTVIIAPIIEELTFRKLIIDRLSRFGAGLAITASSIAFGLFHGNLYQFFYATMLGFLLGFIYVKSGNILYSIALHMTVNFLGSVATLPLLRAVERLEEILLTVEQAELFEIGEFLRIYMTIASYSIVQYAIAGLGIAFTVSFLKHRQYKTSCICEFVIPREKRTSVALYNAGAIVFLVFSLILIVINISLG